MKALPAWWQRLSPREQQLVIAVLAAGIGFVGYQMLCAPLMQRVARVRTEWLGLRQQVTAAKALQPDIARQRQEIDAQTQINQRLEQELKTMERALIAEDDLGRLLGELTRQTEGLQITLDAVKQHVAHDGDDARVAVDIVMTGSFEDLVTYVRRVEHLSAYLRVGRLDVARAKDESKEIEGRMTLASLLRQSGGPGGLPEMPAKPLERVALSRNPFASQARVPTDTKLKDVKVTGITWRGEASTAIVNDSVVRVGDQIDHLTVEHIDAGHVSFSDGRRSYTVSLER